MKTHRQFTLRAFTLLELLVVITIIALLASLAAIQIIRSLDDANRLKVMAVVLDLKSDIDAYHLEYNRFPIASNSASGDQDAPELLTDGSTPLVDALLGIPPSGSGVRDLNPKHIPFSSFPVAKNDRYGLAGAARPYKLTDLWGQPYHILFDTNGDNQVTNPDVANSDPKISQNRASHLASRVAIYSSGKDQLPGTADDIVSWRSR
ncbi:prepilin-type N-terminal cleavage/methylation domain-containing protein [Prosthecobacter sp.]|uniref:prepilin-type N-terminal cleavage/methylation domain-containing protein n=1 Tax=Prosthecobacter sp. TaxID=1965333 RepID=UPI001D349443|nr:prepilin-type N-terminal cleavage/methylation domain-containing protein [Prosthecobacter sp.]MCB1275394.1 prepilin-type N-terminal cleavage/methylation domain-containing protein [Prosthecobacter sp.]